MKHDPNRTAALISAGYIALILLILLISTAAAVELNRVLYGAAGIVLFEHDEMVRCVKTIWTVAAITLFAPLLACMAIYFHHADHDGNEKGVPDGQK